MKTNPVTYEERRLMSLYNTGTRKGLLQELLDMQRYLTKEEQALINLTASAIIKLQEMSDDEYEMLDLVPEFDFDDE